MTFMDIHQRNVWVSHQNQNSSLKCSPDLTGTDIYQVWIISLFCDTTVRSSTLSAPQQSDLVELNTDTGKTPKFDETIIAAFWHDMNSEYQQ